MILLCPFINYHGPVFIVNRLSVFLSDSKMNISNHLRSLLLLSLLLVVKKLVIDDPGRDFGNIHHRVQ